MLLHKNKEAMLYRGEGGYFHEGIFFFEVQ